MFSGEHKSALTVGARRNDQRVCGIKKNVAATRCFAVNNATVCAVCIWMLVSEWAGRGRAVFLSLERGYPLLCPHSVSTL